MKTLNGQELELFRAGNYGAKGSYTPQDLQQLATGYDPAKHEVPLCIGHPTLNAPAFGWLKSLRASGDTLYGTFGQVVPAFDKAVQGGLYKKRSVALVRHADGKLDLRHVGYLGGMVPEVRGLADATFSSDEFQEIEFSVESQGEVDMADEQQKSIRDGIVAFFASLGTKPAEAQTVDLNAMEQRLRTEFSSQLAEKDTKIATLETNFAAQQTAGLSDARQRRIEGVISQLKIDKRWIPAFDAMQVPALFAALGSAPAQEIEFAATTTGGEAVKLDPIAAFSKFLAGLGKIVPEGQVFAAAKTTATVEVPKVDGATVNAGSAAFDAAIRAYMAEHKITDYRAATDALTREGRSSLDYGGAAGGEV